jgi:hypothetical protein
MMAVCVQAALANNSCRTALKMTRRKVRAERDLRSAMSVLDLPPFTSPIIIFVVRSQGSSQSHHRPSSIMKCGRLFASTVDNARTSQRRERKNCERQKHTNMGRSER